MARRTSNFGTIKAEDIIGGSDSFQAYQSGNATTGVKAIFIMPRAGTITSVHGSVGTAPTDASVLVDVHKNGTTIFTDQDDRPTIAATETASSSEAPAVTTFAAGDRLEVIVDQIGSTLPGVNLGVVVEVRYTA